MKKPIYLINEGILYRKGNTIYYQNKDIKKALPINAISEIICYAKVSIRSGATYYLMQLNTPVHFFNKYGYYVGSLYPRDYLVAGKIIIEQSKHYINTIKRLKIAKEIVLGIKHNVLKTLNYYQRRKKEINTREIEEINISSAKDIKELLAYEGRIWNFYYQSFNKILKNFEFIKRDIRPPTDEINALISFGNSLLYTICLTEIYNTYLNPAISYLHEPSERRFSLALDLAELFKPLFVGRTIFSLINRRQINENCFEKIQEGILLNKRGRKLFIAEFDKKLETTIKSPELKRKVSYRRLIRLECYKLIKHILDDKNYKSFRMWW